MWKWWTTVWSKWTKVLSVSWRWWPKKKTLELQPKKEKIIYVENKVQVLGRK